MPEILLIVLGISNEIILVIYTQLISNEIILLIVLGIDIIILTYCMLIRVAVENIHMYGCSSMSTIIDIGYVCFNGC